MVLCHCAGLCTWSSLLLSIFTKACGTVAPKQAQSSSSDIRCLSLSTCWWCAWTNSLILVSKTIIIVIIVPITLCKVKVLNSKRCFQEILLSENSLLLYRWGLAVDFFKLLSDFENQINCVAVKWSFCYLSFGPDCAIYVFFISPILPCTGQLCLFQVESSLVYPCGGGR